MRSLTLLFLVAASWLVAQQAQSEAEGTRELFYSAAAMRKDMLPPIRKAATASKTPASLKSGTPPSTLAGVVHLGLRYNLLLVNPANNEAHPVDGERLFRKGDCLALELQANRSGYIYVLSRQTSGEWQPLLPSPEMPNQTNILNPGEKIRVPRGHCFEITDPPGTETLFVVLSRDPSDIYDLNEGIKGRTPPAAVPQAQPGALLLASATVVKNEVERFSRALQSNDMVVKKVANPVAAGEPPHSFYAVNTSDKPLTRVVTEIRIRHR